MPNLVPRSFFEFPRFPSIWDEDEDLLPLAVNTGGVSVSEDNKNVYVEAGLPGVDPEKIEVTYDRGTLWIRGAQETEEKDKQRKYYRKASSQFSYRLSVPGNIDEKADPEVTCKNGVVKVSFPKVPEVQPKKLTVKKE